MSTLALVHLAIGFMVVAGSVLVVHRCLTYIGRDKSRDGRW